MCFDNHHYGSKKRENYKAAKDSYSRGVRYRINTENMTIEQVWQYGKLESFTVEVCNDKVMLELHLPANFYRGKKMKLYAEGSNLTLGEGKQLGQIGKTPESEPVVCETGCKTFLPNSCEARIEDEADRFTFYSKFKKGEAVTLLLENKNGTDTHQYGISTTALPLLGKSCWPYLDTAVRSTRTIVHKVEMSGEYDVRVVKFETKR